MKKSKILNELAQPKAKIEQSILYLEPQILEHLIKIFIIPANKKDKQIQISHWIREIYAFISIFSKYRWIKNNKHMTPAFYYLCLCLEPLSLDNNPENTQWNYESLNAVIEVISMKYPDWNIKLNQINFQIFIEN